MVGVLARGGKVLDDLANMGYQVAELAEWLGPTSAEIAQAPPKDPHQGAQGWLGLAQG